MTKYSNRIQELLLEGRTYSQIQEDVNCSLSTISYHASKLNLERVHAIDWLEAKRLLNQGAKSEFIMSHLSISKHNWNRRARSHGDVPSTVVNISRPLSGTSLICPKCHKSYVYDKSKNRLTSCNSCRSNKNRDNNKQQAVDYLGGKCKVCGYDRCIKALDFPHLRDKKFTISGHHSRKWTNIIDEIDKCILLCATCHREYHAGLIDLSQFTAP